MIYANHTETVEPIGQAWCLCPYEWGVDRYVLIQSSQGKLALCNVLRVVDDKGRASVRYEPVTRDEIHDLSKP